LPPKGLTSKACRYIIETTMMLREKGMIMMKIISKFSDKIKGSLSTFDRMIFKGHFYLAPKKGWTDNLNLLSLKGRQK